MLEEERGKFATFYYEEGRDLVREKLVVTNGAVRSSAQAGERGGGWR